MKKAPCCPSVSLSSLHPWGLTDLKWFNPATHQEEKELEKKRKKILIKRRGLKRGREQEGRIKKREKTLIFDGGFKGHYWRLWKVTKGWKLWGVESRGWGGVKPQTASSPLTSLFFKQFSHSFASSPFVLLLPFLLFLFHFLLFLLPLPFFLLLSYLLRLLPFLLWWNTK